MNQKDRLAELIGQVQYMGGLEGRLADHLLENGVIVPPCKVGDSVFLLTYDEYGIAPIDKGEVYAVSINEGTNWFSVKYKSGLRYDHTFNDFGKIVFLTREQAEKALEEK